jgi:L-rhamnose mutarotase
MKRKAFVMSVNRGMEEEYQRRHSPIWPELEAVLKDHGVLNYSIFLDDESGQLFGYAEVENEERWAAIAQTPICKNWWKYMKEIMPSNADNSPISRELKEVFHIDALHDRKSQ